MGVPANQRISANRVALVLGLLIVAWVIFVFFPQEAPPEPAAPLQAESKLRSVGLPDNIDLEGLPELFAAWADTKEVKWAGDEALFRYWNPVRKDYSYFVKVVRTPRGYRFHLLEDNKDVAFIPRDRPVEAEGKERLPVYPVYDDDERSPTHPFDFSGPGSYNLPEPKGVILPSTEPGGAPKGPGKVMIEIKPDSPLQVPQPVLKTEDSGGKK